jgi:hypothetical protein
MRLLSLKWLWALIQSMVKAYGIDELEATSKASIEMLSVKI